MTFEEFLKALREGKALTGNGGQTYIRNEGGRLIARRCDTDEEISAPMFVAFSRQGLLKGETGYEICERPILDDAERRYLGSLLRPYGDRVKAIMKANAGTSHQRLVICVAGEDGGWDDYIRLPRFPKGEMYRGMDDERQYASKELGL